MLAWLYPVGGLLALFGLASAGTGPSALYNALNGQTFNPPGYTIVMYQSCMQNQNAGNSCGSFTTFESSNGVYTRQVYGPATCSGSCCRTFHLSFACGDTVSMSGVNENPTCVYSATMTHPNICGLDMTVGNEAASMSPSAPPPSLTSTVTGTQTATATQSASSSSTQTSTETNTATLTTTASSTITGSTTATSTPLFVVTAFPTSTATMTLTATETPLFMVTAWPSPSPINVSATSTPLYYMTAYPSYNPNNNSGLDMVTALIGQAPSSVATILGAVAVGIAGVGALGFAVNHFRKGGSIKGLFDIAKSKQGDIQKFMKDVPLPDSVRQKVDQATEKAEALANDPRGQLALQAVQNPNAALQQAVSSVGLPPSISASLASALPPTGPISFASLSIPVQPPSTPLTLSAAEVSIPVLQQVANSVQTSLEPSTTVPLAPQTATIEMTAEQLAAFQQFLRSK